MTYPWNQRVGAVLPSSDTYFNLEQALNELLAGGKGLSTATLSNVSSSASSVSLLASNSNRKGSVFFNDSTAILYLAFAATASTTSFTYRLTPNSTLELYGEKNFTGAISGIWASANGAARITELTV